MASNLLRDEIALVATVDAAVMDPSLVFESQAELCGIGITRAHEEASILTAPVRWHERVAWSEKERLHVDTLEDWDDLINIDVPLVSFKSQKLKSA